MTREEARKTISKMLSVTDLTVRANMTAQMIEACHMAIKALEQEPCEDVVSRRRVFSAIHNTHLPKKYEEPLWNKISALSSVTPKNDVLDKIRAEIQKLRGCSCNYSDGIIDDVEDIIGKYREVEDSVGADL